MTSLTEEQQRTVERITRHVQNVLSTGTLAAAVNALVETGATMALKRYFAELNEQENKENQ